MRHLNSQWRLSIGRCLFVFEETYRRASPGFFRQEVRPMLYRSRLLRVQAAQRLAGTISGA